MQNLHFPEIYPSLSTIGQKFEIKRLFSLHPNVEVFS